jgi:hypothetical protein
VAGCLTGRLNFKEPARDTYKLTIVGNPNIIQGLISIEVKNDHVFMHLVESAPFNKGKTKVYSGVPGNLVAFTCKLSFQRGHEVMFHSCLNPNLLNITLKLSVLFILAAVL